jgi:hypothetical protein
MTEALSLGLYAVVLHRSFFYLRDRRLFDLALVQAVSVVLIGFRMSYLLLVQIDTVILPLLAFAPEILDLIRRRVKQALVWPAFRNCGLHLLTSLVSMFVLHAGYKQANGLISERPPAYLHATGVTLLAFLSPVLEPEDSPDSGLADIIRHGDEMGLKDINLRNAQRFSPNYLIDRFSKLVPERSSEEKIARETAMNALRRNPFGVIKMAWRVYSDYWSKSALKDAARSDFGFNNPPREELMELLASRFHMALDEQKQTTSSLQKFSVRAWPYYFLILLAPLLSGIATIFRPTRPYALLLFLHITVSLTVSNIFGGQSIRYFQPISLATILILAIYARYFLSRRETARSTNAEEEHFVPRLSADTGNQESVS